MTQLPTPSLSTSTSISTPTFPVANTVDDFRANLAAVRARMDAACVRAGRPTEAVRLLSVSKTVDNERIRLAYAAGCRDLGENKVQEAYGKSQDMADLADIRWSVIGHLQTNKARYVARFASEFQALDSVRVAQALETQLQKEQRQLDVFIQVNTSGEASKYGLPPEEALAFARQLTGYETLRVRGLMTLAIRSTDATRVRACFGRLRAVQEQLRQDAPAGLCFDDLSMGMSGDFEAAIEEGATVVRVGQAIFGQRATPDALYWPGLTT